MVKVAWWATRLQLPESCMVDDEATAVSVIIRVTTTGVVLVLVIGAVVLVLVVVR